MELVGPLCIAAASNNGNQKIPMPNAAAIHSGPTGSINSIHSKSPPIRFGQEGLIIQLFSIPKGAFIYLVITFVALPLRTTM